MRSARKPDGIVDRFLGATSFTLLSIPPYILIIVMVLFISIKLGVSGTGPSAYVSFGTDWITNLESLSLPAFTLATGSFVSTTACCAATSSRPCKKSSSPWRAPKDSVSAASCGATPFARPRWPCSGGQRQHRRLLAAGFVVQYLLQIPGLGYTLILAINESDFLVVQGIVLTVSILVVAINFFFDFIINIVDRGSAVSNFSLADAAIMVERPEKSRPLGLFFWICVFWVGLNIFGAIFANLLPLANPLNENFNAINAGPGLHHLLGTDDLGRDIFSRIVYGSRSRSPWASAQSSSVTALARLGDAGGLSPRTL